MRETDRKSQLKRKTKNQKEGKILKKIGNRQINKQKKADRKRKTDKANARDRQTERARKRERRRMRKKEQF